MTVFLSGPLSWQPLLKIVLIEDPDTVQPRDAEVQGYALRQHPQQCFPQLAAAEDCTAGRLVDLSPDSYARLSYLASGLGCETVTASVKTGSGQTDAVLFATRAPQLDFDRPWQHDPWQARWGGIALAAAEEVMQHFGHIPGGDLPGYMPMILVRAAARQAALRDIPTDVRTAMTAEQVEVIERHNRHVGFFLTREYTLRHPEFSGAVSPPVKREVFVATDAAIVLPYDPVRDRVLLVEQFRMGPFGRGDPKPWMLEPVAGRVDPGETPEETARRECVEEAGLSLGRLEHISCHYCSLGCSTEYFHCFLGLCALPDLKTGQGGLEAEDEDIRTHVLTFEQAMALVPSGEAANGPLILSLLWLQRERERLRRGG